MDLKLPTIEIESQMGCNKNVLQKNYGKQLNVMKPNSLCGGDVNVDLIMMLIRRCGTPET